MGWSISCGKGLGRKRMREGRGRERSKSEGGRGRGDTVPNHETDQKMCKETPPRGGKREHWGTPPVFETQISPYVWWQFNHFFTGKQVWARSLVRCLWWHMWAELLRGFTALFCFPGCPSCSLPQPQIHIHRQEEHRFSNWSHKVTFKMTCQRKGPLYIQISAS